MPGLPEERPDGLDSPRAVTMIRWMSRLNVAAFRATNGRLGARWRIGAGWRKPVPVLLLDHVGRKSGKRFTSPLLYLEDGEDVVIVASQGGLPKNPQWYANLAAHPDTTISLRGERDRPVLVGMDCVLACMGADEETTPWAPPWREGPAQAGETRCTGAKHAPPN